MTRYLISHRSSSNSGVNKNIVKFCDELTQFKMWKKEKNIKNDEDLY